MKERVLSLQENPLDWLKAQASNSLLSRIQQQQLAAFLNRGLPSRREEAWKYTDVSFLEKMHFSWPSQSEIPHHLRELVAERSQDKILLVFINGRFAPALSSLETESSGLIISNIQEALEKHAPLIQKHRMPELDVKRHPFASLNQALFRDGLFLYVPRNLVLEKPVHLLSVTTEPQALMQPRHLIIMENDAHLTLIDEYLSLSDEPYWSNSLMDMVVGPHSLLNYYKIQNEGKQAKHMASLFMHQQEHSFINAGFFALGGQWSRTDVLAGLLEKNASCRFKGFYGLNEEGQFCDYHLHVDHAAPHTHSEIDFRGVLSKPARAVFQGKVVVAPQAQKSRAEQVNHNILLSPMAEVDTKPDLEIYADDVQCRHGATVGQLSEEALFYLMSRGIDHRTATRLLLQALMEPVLSAVSLPALVESLQAMTSTAGENLS